MKLLKTGTISDYLPNLEYAGSDKFIEKLCFLFIDIVSVSFLLIISSAINNLFLKILPQSSSWIGVLWYIGVLAALILFITNFKNNLIALKYAIPFLILNIWIIASYKWSTNQAETLRSIIFLTASQIGALSFAVRYKWEKAIKMIAFTLVSLMALAVIVSLIIPSIGRMQEIHPGAWSGLWMEKQAMGMFAVHTIIAISAIAIYNHNYRYLLLFIPICLLAIIGSTGKSALIMLGAALACIGFTLIFRTGIKRAIIITWVTIIIVSLISIVSIFFSDEVFQLLGRSKNITGRTEVWEGVDYLITQKNMYGWGYGTIWREAQNPISAYQWVSEIAGFEASNAHSSYRDAHMQIGFIGLCLLIIACIYTILNSIIALGKNKYAAIFGLASIASIMFISFTETILLTSLDYQWFLFVFLGIKLAMPNEDKPLVINKSIRHIENTLENDKIFIYK